MPFLRWRRALLTAACAFPIVLAACGGGDIVSEFNPSRVVVFGDASADAGQRGVRYTINDGTATTWAQHLARRYGLSVAPSTSGGTAYATGSARISAKPDASGNAATPTVAEQITAYLAAGTPPEGDLVVVSAGIADLLAQVAALRSGAQTQEQTNENARLAAREMGAQVRRLVNAGAKRVIVTGPYNLGRSPWARATGQTGFLQDLVTQFNDALKVAIVDLGGNVLYVDAALYFNLVTGEGAANAYGFSDVTSVACNSVDAGAGIGIGTGQVNSALCTGSTIAVGAPTTTLFADPVYFTPAGHVKFGDYAYDRTKERW